MPLHTFTNGEHVTIVIPLLSELEQLVEEVRIIEAASRHGYQTDPPAPTLPVQIDGIYRNAEIFPIHVIDHDIAVLVIEVASPTTILDNMNHEVSYYFIAATRTADAAWHLPENTPIVHLVTDDENGTEEFFRLPASEQLRLLGY